MDCAGVQALQLTCQSLACKVFLLNFELVAWTAFACLFRLFYPCTAGTRLEAPFPHAMVLLMPCYLVSEFEFVVVLSCGVQLNVFGFRLSLFGFCLFLC